MRYIVTTSDNQYYPLHTGKLESCQKMAEALTSETEEGVNIEVWESNDFQKFESLYQSGWESDGYGDISALNEAMSKLRPVFTIAGRKKPIVIIDGVFGFGLHSKDDDCF